MFPQWTWIVGFFLGATIGSFLNVVIYRLPRGLSLAEPKHSFCPICKHALGPQDLFPLISWLSTGGKCRYCKAPIPFRYQSVELMTGALWAGIWYRFFIAGGPNPDVIQACIFLATAATLVSIIYIDWELYIIPDQINAFLLFLGALQAALKNTWPAFFMGWFVGWAALWGIALIGRLLFGKDAMGHGDIKMMRGIGSIIGAWLIGANMAIAVLAGLIMGIVGIAISTAKKAKEPEAEEPEEPYQPEPIKDLFVLGGTYLLALDIPAIWYPKIYEKLGYAMEPETIEEDDWKPSITTIPFGPYLAIGALVCMLYADGIRTAWDGYWKRLTEPTSMSLSVTPNQHVRGDKLSALDLGFGPERAGPKSHFRENRGTGSLGLQSKRMGEGEDLHYEA